MKLPILVTCLLALTQVLTHAADLPRPLRRERAEIYVRTHRAPPRILYSPDLNETCSLVTESCQSDLDCCGQVACVAGYCGGPDGRFVPPPRPRPVPACHVCAADEDFEDGE